MRVIHPIDELGRLQAESTHAFVVIMADLQAAAVGGPEANDALDQLASLLAESSGLSDMIGRRRLLLEADAARGARQPVSMLYAEPKAIARVPFTQAIARIVKAEPRLAKGAEEVSELYRTDKFFAMARSINLKLTAEVQRVIQRSMKAGTEAGADVERIVRIGAGEWTRAYAQTVYRTNLSTAYNAGRLTIAKDPMVAEDFPGFRYTAVGDQDTRDNHEAADGTLALTRDPIWQGPQGLKPPMGYNCRCTLELASRDDFRRAGMVMKNGEIAAARRPTGAYPDPGFRR